MENFMISIDVNKMLILILNDDYMFMIINSNLNILRLVRELMFWFDFDFNNSLLRVIKVWKNKFMV